MVISYGHNAFSNPMCEIDECNGEFITIMIDGKKETISIFDAKGLENYKRSNTYFTDRTIKTLKDEGYLGQKKREERLRWL